MCLRVSYKKKIWEKNNLFCILKVTEEKSRVPYGSGSLMDPDPDPLVRGQDMEIRIWIRTKMSRIPNTAWNLSPRRLWHLGRQRRRGGWRRGQLGQRGVRHGLEKEAGAPVRLPVLLQLHHQNQVRGTSRHMWVNVSISVADPNPDPHLDPDPHVFEPPGSGSGSISQRYRFDPDPSIIKQNGKETLDFYCFVTSFWLLIFEK